MASTRNADQVGKEKRVSRRGFLGGAAASAFAFTIVPRHVLGGPGQTPPSEKINIAGIGVGGQGGGNMNALASQNIVALCDVDDDRAAGTFKRFPDARRYKDFREMLDKEEKNIDGVMVATPDHVHAAASMAAIKRGKHVYCEKPLTHTIYEARQLKEAAREHKVATQMGNSGHSSEGARLTNEWVQAGVIGEVREVHVWTNRAGNMWKQGIPRPAETPPVRSSLAWDLWLGPAPERPYHPVYAPFSWRGWWDFGTGALGDMACHIIDHPYWALKLGHPSSVQAYMSVVGSVGGDKALNRETYPLASVIYYEFPARGDLPPVSMTWYDGGLLPRKPAEMQEGHNLPSNGALFVGDKGKLYCGSHGGHPRLIPASREKDFQHPPKTYARSIGHHKEWVEACKGGPLPIGNFDYSGALSECVLLGNIALRAPGKRLMWDGENMKVTNAPELNQFVHREYRKGWTL